MKVTSLLTIITTVTILSACASTVIIPEGTPTASIEITNNLEGGYLYLQRAGIAETCSGGWGKRIIAKKDKIAQYNTIANEDNSFLLQQFPQPDDIQCTAIITVNLAESETISLSFNKNEDGICFVEGQTEKVIVREYQRSSDGFCKPSL